VVDFARVFNEGGAAETLVAELGIIDPVLLLGDHGFASKQHVGQALGDRQIVAVGG
jgi:hypothetical protein